MRTARTEWVIVATLVVFASAVRTDGRQAPVTDLVDELVRAAGAKKH